MREIQVSVNERHCPRCNLDLPISSFYPSCPSYCKKCWSSINKIQRDRQFARRSCKCCGRALDSKGRLCKECVVKASFRATQKRREFKLAAIEFLGGKCVDCGYSDLTYISVFDFHHLHSKDTNIAQMFAQNKPWLVIVAELQKCELICANCHRIRHEKEG